MESYTDEFSYFPKLFERPTQYEVLTQLVPIDAKWYEIGIGLRVSDNDLQGLAQSNMSNVVRLNHVVQKWIDMDGESEGAPVTWTTILDVIKGPIVQNKALALEIYEYLEQQSAISQEDSTQIEQTNEANLISDFPIVGQVFPTFKSPPPNNQPKIPDDLLYMEPKKHHLLTLLHPIRHMWRSIGEQLLLRHGDIRSLEYNSPYDDSIRLSEVFQVWIDERPCEVSWRKIITVVKEPPIENVVVADDIYQFLTRPEIKNEYLSYNQPGNVITPSLPIQQKPSDMKGISTDGTSGHSLSTDEQASLHQVIDTKKIIFDEKDLIGKGSQGTLVYKGSFGSIDVAVKRVVSEQFNDLVKGEIDILQENDWHLNIVRFYFMEEDVGYINIALELCDCTLFEFVKGSKLQNADCKALLLGAMKGVDHLHKFNIIHRDLKPQNVLLKLTPSNDVIPLISDFGLCRKLADDQTHMTTKYGMAGTLGWIAPEMSEDESKVTRAVDIFAMGCIIYYVLSRGRHPFGRGEHPFDPMNSQVRIRKKKDGKVTLSDLEGEDKFIAENLVRVMIKSNQESRPSSGEVLAHCLFWSKDKQLKFFQQVSDWIQWALTKQPTGSNTVDNLEVGVENVFKDEWVDSIEEELKRDLIKYKGKLLRELLRAIRNKSHHYYELPESLKTKLGSVPEGFVTYFTSHFPYLLIHTYKVMKEEPNFKERHPDFFKT